MCNFIRGKAMYLLCLAKVGWATSRAFFAPTRLVALQHFYLLLRLHSFAVFVFLEAIRPHLSVARRVARWFLFRPKIPIWVNFGGP
jgi:hypothetical protein